MDLSDTPSPSTDHSYYVEQVAIPHEEGDDYSFLSNGFFETTNTDDMDLTGMFDGLQVSFRNSRMVYSLFNGPNQYPRSNHDVSLVDSTGSIQFDEDRNKIMGLVNIEVGFEGSNEVIPQGHGNRGSHVNQIRGIDPSKWLLGGASYDQVVYREIYNGMDLHIYHTPEGPKYEFRLDPYANSSAILFALEGQDYLELDESGALVIHTPLGTIADMGLRGYYADRPDETIDVSFVLYDESRYGFQLETYDQSRAIVIDPLVVSTYLGGSSNDRGLSMAVDSLGNIYIAGLTWSSNIPSLTGYCATYQGGRDAFISKISPDGGSILWSTYIGGSADDVCTQLTVDDAGNVFVVGQTKSHNFPTTPGAYNRTHSTGNHWDGFICKISNDGKTLVYSSFLSGSRDDTIFDVEVNPSGRAYVCGLTGSDDFPTTSGAYQEINQRGGGDGFVTIIEDDGGSLVSSTFYGDVYYDVCRGLTFDSSGQVFVAGITNSFEMQTTPGAFQTSFGGGLRDAFVARFDPSLSNLVFSSFLGGMESGEEATDIEVDSEGCAYISGYTDSDDFPTTIGAFQRSYGGGFRDAFVTKISKDGGSLVYSTYIGGEDLDIVNAFDLDEYGYLYVVGLTSSSDLPTTDEAFMATHNGGDDAFLARVGKDGDSLEYCSYLGTSGVDEGKSLVEVGNGYLFVCGVTNSRNFPTSDDVLQPDLAGSQDAFISKFRTDVKSPIAKAGPDQIVDQNSVVQFNGSDSMDDFRIVNWTWTVADGTETVHLYGPSPSYIFDAAGVYIVTLNVTDSAGLGAGDIVNITVLDTQKPVADAGEDIVIDQHETVTFNGSGSKDLVGIANYTWTFSYNSTVINLFGKTPSFTFDLVGKYVVFLNVSDARGNWGIDLLNVTVRDTTPPVAAAGEDISVVEGTIAHFTGMSSSDNIGITNWTWTINLDGIQEETYGTEAEFLFTSLGKFDVELKVTDAAGLWSTDLLIVTVTDGTPPIADAGPNMTIDQGDSVTLDGSLSTDNIEVVNWTWQFFIEEDEINLSGKAQVYIFDKVGEFLIWLIVKDETGLEDRDNLTIFVMDVERPVAQVPGDVEIEQHQEAEFNGSLCEDNVRVMNWTWTFDYIGEQQTLYGRKAYFTFDDAGLYPVTLSILDRAGNVATTSFTIIVTDIDPPVAVIKGSLSLDEGKKADLDGTDSSDNVAITKWIWSFNYEGEEKMVEGQSLEFRFDEPGRYQITLEVQDAAGLSSSDTVDLLVNELDAYPMSNFYLLIIVAIVVIMGVVLFMWTKRRQQ